MAHEDLDLGIESVTLTKQCKAKIVVKNYGHELPEAFYHTVTPAFLSIKKGGKSEDLRSLRALDRRRQLAQKGGRLTLFSKNSYANIREPLYVDTHYDQEFGDYGAGNNKKIETMDCVVGQGQIEGAPIVYTQPDVALTDARISPQTCQLTITIENLTGVALDQNSWLPEQGVSVMRLNLQTHLRAPDVPLITLDPNKQFGKKGVPLSWDSELPFVDANNIRVGLWRVSGDLDFSNNTIELAVPNNCSEETLE